MVTFFNLQFRIFLWVALLFTQSCITRPEPSGEPLRVGIISFDAELNRVKPLGVADFSGWTESGSTIIGAFDRRWVAAYSMKTSKVLWWHEGSEDLSAPAAVNGEDVLIGLRNGQLLMLSLKDGKKKWEVMLGAQLVRRAFIGDDIILAQTAAQQLYALDRKKGTTLWIYDAGFPDGLTLQGAAPPIVANGSAIMGLANGEVHAISLSTGRMIWKNDEDISQRGRFHDVIGEFLLKGEQLVFARYDGSVVGLSLTSSQAVKAWSEEFGSITFAGPGQKLFFVGTYYGEIYGFDPQSGKKVWVVKTGVPIVDVSDLGKEIFAAGGNGRIYGLDPKKASILWSDDLDAAIGTKPIRWNHGIYYATGFKNLYGYRYR